MIVDAHVHILPDRIRDNPALLASTDPWFAACHARGERIASAESLLAAMDEHGVDRAVCFTWPFADPAVSGLLARRPTNDFSCNVLFLRQRTAAGGLSNHRGCMNTQAVGIWMATQCCATARVMDSNAWCGRKSRK